MESNNDERRDYKRVKNEFNVRIAKQKFSNQFEELEIDIAKAINVSASGILISVKKAIEIDAIIRVNFLKPNSFDFFEGLGKVVRIEDNSDDDEMSYLLGIRFEDLGDADKKKLNYYITLIEE